jgi:thioredoxin reductase
MKNKYTYDVIVIGGSYAGLSAAMALGRSLRKVLIIDGGKPCNRQTPHSHNFLTRDGERPTDISRKALEEVLMYPTVHMHAGLAVGVEKNTLGFSVETGDATVFTGRRVLFATGLADQFPEIDGFAPCWGISVLHCPYCHGYEVRDQTLALVANGDAAFEFCKLISNWSKDLTLLTNGTSSLTEEQTGILRSKQINIVEKEIAAFVHEQGHIQKIVFNDQSSQAVKAVFARTGFTQHSDLPAQLGCEINRNGFIQVDDFQKTSIPGVYAAGDNTNMLRSVSSAVAAGTRAGAFINKELIDEDF